ncbi:D-alanyl-D-alanine carboxypeptidase family protein [Kitasatospora sp. NPDC089509]|uniref:D-alanyl-D-alanine carboxypeptidase family protein n=1 Tax=Kitasatospora sp. NPDC089509 TaxID=3364079 RepID=UPI003808AE30
MPETNPRKPVPLRRRFTRSISAATTLLLVVPAAAAAGALPPSLVGLFGLKAKGAVLIDAADGRTMWAQDPGTARQPASATKIMTALIVLDRPGTDLDREVTVEQAYADYVNREHASSADLQPGDRLTVRQLLYALLLPSGCDAAFALADAFGTGITVTDRTRSFVRAMNEKARDLGLSETEFSSFDGVAETGRNLTTPRNLAELARQAMKNATFRAIVGTAKTEQEAPAGNGRIRYYSWENTNRLVGTHEGVVGVKTGTGKGAGPCLVFAASWGGRTVIGVLLDDRNRYRDAEKLLSWAKVWTGPGGI